ncbi:MAG: hypothetical protein CMM58_06945 [Rhodospirillaceae bacterium]|nr:hypothetical protein [Rhodospirillaceae bacterium]
MSVIIYRPSKTAMQSGKAKTRGWILEHKLVAAGRPEPLMGWSSSVDTKSQVRLSFQTKEEAIAYAEKHSLTYTVQVPKEVRPKLKAYADNFSYKRNGSWTH